MKHNTHIYLAAQAIEFLRYVVDNLVTRSGAKSTADRGPYRDKAKWLQRLMREHRDAI